MKSLLLIAAVSLFFIPIIFPDGGSFLFSFTASSINFFSAGCSTSSGVRSFRLRSPCLQEVLLDQKGLPLAKRQQVKASIYASLSPSSVTSTNPFVRNLPGLRVLDTGSASQSFDGDPRASYLLFDDRKPTIRRVEYDADREIEAIYTGGLPNPDRFGCMVNLPDSVSQPDQGIGDFAPVQIPYDPRCASCVSL